MAMGEQHANEMQAQADMGSAGGRYARRRREGTRRDSAVDRQEGAGAQTCAARREAESQRRRSAAETWTRDSHNIRENEP